MPTINRGHIAVEVFTQLSNSSDRNIKDLLRSLKDNLMPTGKESFYFITLNRLLKLLVEYDNDRTVNNPGVATNNLKTVWPKIICHIVTKLSNSPINYFNLHEFNSLYSMIFKTVLLGDFPKVTIANCLHEKFRMKSSITRLINYAFIANEFQRQLHINIIEDFRQVIYSENTSIECFMEYSDDKFSHNFLQSTARMRHQVNRANNIDLEIKCKGRRGEKISSQQFEQRDKAICHSKVLFNEVFFSFERILSETGIPEHQTEAQINIMQILNFKLESMLVAHIKRWGNPASLSDYDLLMALRDTSFKHDEKLTSLLLESSKDQLTNISDHDEFSLKTLLCVFATLNSSRSQSDYENMLHNLRKMWQHIIVYIADSFVRSNQYKKNNISSEDFNNLYKIIFHTLKLGNFPLVELPNELYKKLTKLNNRAQLLLRSAYVANGKEHDFRKNLFDAFNRALETKQSSEKYFMSTTTDVFTKNILNLLNKINEAEEDMKSNKKNEDYYHSKYEAYKIKLTGLITMLRWIDSRKCGTNLTSRQDQIMKFRILKYHIRSLTNKAGFLTRSHKKQADLSIKKRTITTTLTKMSIVSTTPMPPNTARKPIENPSPKKRMRR
jgi:hypothetical protein